MLRRDGEQVLRRAGAAPRAACACPARRRGRSSARAAFSRKCGREQRRAARARRATQLLDLVGLGQQSVGRRRAGSSSSSAKRRTMPSSLHSTWTSSRARRRASSASAQGAWTRAPNGDRMQTRQSPSSSRKRSTTIARSSVGSAPVASCCSRDVARRGSRAARVVEPVLAARSHEVASSSRRAELAHERAERAAELERPPGPSPRQNGILPGSPGAGVTMTRSRGDLRSRHVDAPSRNVCPTRRSCTISSSSSPMRGPSVPRWTAVEPAVGDRARADARR